MTMENITGVLLFVLHALVNTSQTTVREYLIEGKSLTP